MFYCTILTARPPARQKLSNSPSLPPISLLSTYLPLPLPPPAAPHTDSTRGGFGSHAVEWRQGGAEIRELERE